MFSSRIFPGETQVAGQVLPDDIPVQPLDPHALPFQDFGDLVGHRGFTRTGQSREPEGEALLCSSHSSQPSALVSSLVSLPFRLLLVKRAFKLHDDLGHLGPHQLPRRHLALDQEILILVR